MEFGNTSRERRRLSKNLTTSNRLLNEEYSPQNYSFEKEPLKHFKNASTPVRTRHSTNVKTIVRQNTGSNDDSDDEENTDEYSSSKQHVTRRGSISPEGIDQNITPHDNVKGKVEAIPATLHKREKRRKKRKQRSHQSEEKRISSTWENNEEDIDEDRSSVKQLGSIAKKNYSDTFRRSTDKKNRKDEGDHRNELPITEILRKAQENSRTQYEEPIPLPQLTTDTIYVQGRNGFSAVKIPSERITRGHRDPESGATVMYPIKVAILAQKAWKNAGLIYQGLLAGMAVMHFLVMKTYFKPLEQSVEDYSAITEIYTNIFSFFVVMCIISAFDKFDIAHCSYEHLKEIYTSHARSLLAIPIYLVVFCLHQSTMRIDDKLSLMHYNSKETRSQGDNNTIIVTTEELNNWQTINLTKDGLAVLAWIFISLGPQNDMLLTHLQAMERYAEHNSS